MVKFSLIIPMYNVVNYLDDLTRSFDRLVDDSYEVEFIFVDDGSPDESAAFIDEWKSRSRHSIMLLRQENRGVSAARNKGIEVATGDWISFPDPDDYVSANYLQAVSRFLASKRGDVSLVSTNIQRYFEEFDEVRDSHALRFKFARGTKRVDLEASPHYIHMSAPTGFFRRDVLMDENIRFKEGLHASEDALFSAEYLLTFDSVSIGLVSDAIYYYRKRADESSAIDSFRKSPNAYFTRFEKGYKPLLEHTLKWRGKLPDWLASQILYEYRWLFSSELSSKTRSNVLTAEQKKRFLKTSGELLSLLSDYHIEQYRTTPMKSEIRYVLQAIRGKQFPTGTVKIGPLDKEQNLVQISYYFCGDLPVEEFRVRAKIVSPVYSKVQSLDYFDQSALRKRIAWIPANSWVAIKLDGVPQGLSFDDPDLRTMALTERQIEKSLAPTRQWSTPEVPPPVTGVRSLVKWSKQKFASPSTSRVALDSKELLRDQAQRRAQRVSTARKYERSWIFIDRIDRAGDNAEHLYDWIQNSRPDLNAFFVLQRDSKDWNRLRVKGFQLIEYGSAEHFAALVFARYVISSHADVEMVRPLPDSFYPNGRRPWRFVFLQHGVTKDDLSHWLNPKDIDLIVCATDEEAESITTDGSRYRFTGREVKVTGFPRFDRLSVLAGELEKDVLLIAPTWRDGLLSAKTVGSSERMLKPGAGESNFYQSWRAFLGSNQLQDLCRKHQLTPVFLPHPNLTAHLDPLHLPSSIAVSSYEEDVQTLFARSKLVVTDYSSVFFDVAYCGGKVIYYQFDREAHFKGAHTMVEGYFRYDAHGFGPVVSGAEEIFAVIDDELQRSGGPLNLPFVFTDDRNSERVIAAIEALDIPVKKV